MSSPQPAESSLATPSETTPLLSDRPGKRRTSTSSTSAFIAPTSSSGPQSRHHPAFFYVTILVGLFSLVADLGGALLDTPEVRLLEMAVCRDYYRAHDPSIIGPPPLAYVPERLCKVKEIQSELAYLRATKSLLMNLPGLILTFFYCRLADKIGRKPVMLLGMTGQVLAYFWVIVVCYFHEVFPTRLVLASPAFLLIGGGVRVLSAIVNALVVDVCPPDMRTTVFYLIGALVLITDIVAVPIGSWLLSKDLWLPYWFSTPIILLSYPIIFLIPETASTKDSDNTEEGSGSTSNHSYQPAEFTPMPRKAYRKLRKSIKAFALSTEITICLTVIFLNTFSRSSSGIFIQYVSNLLGWPISKVGFLLSVKAAVSLSILVGLALLTRILTARSSTRSMYVDVWVARLSLALLVAGNLTLGFGTNSASIIAGSIIASGGNGIVQVMQGIIAAFAKSTVTAQLYAGVALVELVAGLTGGLAFAALFNVGLGLDSLTGLGLPFFISAILLGIALLIAFFLPTRVA